MADALAAEFVAGFDDAFVGDEFQWLLATQPTHGVQGFEDFAGRLTRTFQWRRVDGGNGVQLRTDGDVVRGSLRHTHSQFGQVESGKTFVEQMLRILDLAVTHEVDGCCMHGCHLSAGTAPASASIIVTTISPELKNLPDRLFS